MGGAEDEGLSDPPIVWSQIVLATSRAICSIRVRIDEKSASKAVIPRSSIVQ